MAPKTATSTPARRQSPSRPRLAYRVNSGGDNGRVFQPANTKYTIGSLPSCNVSVAGEGVRPVHCIVIHGPCQTIVRRWAPDSHLNGRAYDDASLAVGDRLQVGEVELEIIAGDQIIDGPGAGQACEAVARTAGRGGELSPGRAESQQNRNVERRLRRRARRLLAALRHERTLRTSAERDSNSASNDYHALIKRLALLDATRASERSEWRRQVSELEANSKRLQQVCATLEEERDALRQRLASSEHADQQSEQNKRELEFAARAKCHDLEWRLEELRSTLNAEREEFQRQRAEWDQQAEEEEEAAQRNNSFREAEHALREDLAKREAEISDLQNRIAQAEADVQTARSDQQIARQTADSMTEELARRDAQLQELTERLADREKSLDAQRQSWEEELARESQRLLAEQHTSREEAEELRRELAEQLDTAKELAEGRRAWEDERAALLDQHQAELQAASETEAALRAELSGQIETLREALTSALDAAEQSRASANAAAVQLAKRDAQIDELREALQATRNAQEQAPESVDPPVSICAEVDEGPEPPVDESSAGDSEMQEELEEALGEDASHGEDETLELDHIEADPRDTEAAIAHLRALNIWQQDDEDDADQPVGSSSYIERFSSMFEDERAAGTTPIEGGCREIDLVHSAPEGMADLSPAGAAEDPIETTADEAASGADPQGTYESAETPEIDDYDDDDESLQGYLAKLAERIRGEPAAASSPGPAWLAAATSPTRSFAASPSVPHEQTSGDDPHKTLMRLEDIKRDVVIPERSADFEAMRKLANATARDAIGVHETRAHRYRMLNKVLAAAVGLLCGVWTISAAPEWLSLQTGLGAVVIAAGLYWTGQTLALLLGAIRRGSLDEADEVIKPERPASPRNESTAEAHPDKEHGDTLNWIDEPASQQ